MFNIFTTSSKQGIGYVSTPLLFFSNKVGRNDDGIGLLEGSIGLCVGITTSYRHHYLYNTIQMFDIK